MGRAPSPVAPTWYSDLTRGWFRALRRRGRAPKTLRTYRWAAGSFGAFLAGQHVAGPGQLNADVLHRWQDELGRLEPNSQLTCASAIRGLLRWAAREELGVRPGLWEHIDTIRVPEALPRALDREALRKILTHYSRARQDLDWMRDRALFMFLLTAGSRIGEALSLNRDQVARMVVRVKGGHEHLVIPSEQARAWLQAYLRARGRDDQPALWIRVGPRGRHRLREPEANQTWRDLCDRLGLDPFTCHALRHTCATEWGERGASDSEIAQHLGWRNTSMARRYRQLREERRQLLADGLDDLVVPDVAPGPAPALRRPPAYVVRNSRRGPPRGRTLPA